MHDEDLESMWVGSYINCSRPWVEVTESICTPSLFDMSYIHQFDDRALKSPIIMEIASFWLDIAFIKTSKFLRNFLLLRNFRYLTSLVIAPTDSLWIFIYSVTLMAANHCVKAMRVRVFVFRALSKMLKDVHYFHKKAQFWSCPKYVSGKIKNR